MFKTVQSGVSIVVQNFELPIFHLAIISHKVQIKTQEYLRTYLIATVIINVINSFISTITTIPIIVIELLLRLSFAPVIPHNADLTVRRWRGDVTAKFRDVVATEGDIYTWYVRRVFRLSKSAKVKWKIEVDDKM